MELSNEQIRERVAKNRKRPTIEKAILQQNRLRFHAETELTAAVLQPTADFLAFVSNILPHDKFKLFKTLFRYPVATNEVTSVIFDKLSRIFDGRNAAFNYQFTNTESRDDWEAYRSQQLREPQVWQTLGWDFFKTEINSVLIVDLPTEQDKNELPEPYFYFLPIDRVIDFEVDRHSGLMRYIIFRQDGERIAVIDDERYRVFKESKGKQVGELIADNPHDLGYCPARFFWSEPISLNEPDVKASPLTKVLEKLDWYLFYALSKRHLDLYGSYPIYSGYEEDCDFSNSETGDYCDGGFLKDRQGHYLYDKAGLLLRCPKCGDRRIAGVGSFVEIPVPKDGQPDLRNPVQMLSVDRNSLDYNTEECKRLRTEIITAVVGQNEEITQREALNEQQIMANFESQSTVLKRVKKGFESAQQFVDETCCRLRYGDDFVSASVDYGTDFYIVDANTLRERYAKAKQNGASEGELDALQNQIIQTEYRNDAPTLRRMLILAELEPYRHLTVAEATALYKDGLIDAQELRLKLNFSTLIRRFERENINIAEFGENTTYRKKIETIGAKLREYAAEGLNNNNSNNNQNEG